MASLFLFFLFRVILRNAWLAAAGFVALGAFLTAAGSAVPAESAGLAVLYVSLLLWVMIRFGVLPGVLMQTISAETFNWPLTSDFSAWYADKGLIVVALVLSLAVWSFRNALGGRKVLQGDLL